MAEEIEVIKLPRNYPERGDKWLLPTKKWELVNIVGRFDPTGEFTRANFVLPEDEIKFFQYKDYGYEGKAECFQGEFKFWADQFFWSEDIKRSLIKEAEKAAGMPTFPWYYEIPRLIPGIYTPTTTPERLAQRLTPTQALAFAVKLIVDSELARQGATPLSMQASINKAGTRYTYVRFETIAHASPINWVKVVEIFVGAAIGAGILTAVVDYALRSFGIDTPGFPPADLAETIKWLAILGAVGIAGYGIYKVAQKREEKIT